MTRKSSLLGRRRFQLLGSLAAVLFAASVVYGSSPTRRSELRRREGLPEEGLRRQKAAAERSAAALFFLRGGGCLPPLSGPTCPLMKAGQQG